LNREVEGGLGDVKFTLVSYLPRYPTDLEWGGYLQRVFRRGGYLQRVFGIGDVYAGHARST
jgi:hypothetical protein